MQMFEERKKAEKGEGAVLVPATEFEKVRLSV
jgi:hypothetical protein